MSDNLLMVGASLAQVGGIRIAKDLGFKVIAIDGDSNAPGLKAADVGIVLDVRDREGAIRIAKEYCVHAATSIASEICLPTVAAVNQACRFPGLLEKQSSLVTNKGAMRQKYLEHSVPSPRFFIIKEEGQLSYASDFTGFPAVVKPVDGSGSKGVSLVNNFDELKTSYLVARSFSWVEEVILEEFMEGPEISVEAFVIDGKIYILTLSDKLRTQPPHLLDTCVMFPSAYPKHIQGNIKEVAYKAIRALGLDNCPIHMELILTHNGPKMTLGAPKRPF